MKRRRLFSIVLVVPTAFAAYACSDDETTSTVTTPAADAAADATVTPVVSDGATPPVDAGPRTLELKFEGRVGDEIFGCGKTFANLGTSDASATAGDFRFFVSNVKLVRTTGEEITVTLGPNGDHQNAKVALIDFENKTGDCAFGTTTTNDVIRGTVPSGDYSGVVFTVGVPEDLNHSNVDLAEKPLVGSALQWDWTTGFIHFAVQLNPTKTTTLDDGGTLTPPSFFSHVGSTGCTGNPAADAAVVCGRSNRPVVRLTGFDPTTSKIVVDAKKLYTASNIDENTPGTIPGCMSGQNDPECPAIFARLGLDFDAGTVSGAPVVFSVAPR